MAEDSKTRSQLYAELESLSGKLIELGIKSNKMHVVVPLHVLKSNPVKFTEYIAGQILETTGENLVSESEDMPIIQEMGEEKDGKHVIAGNMISPKVLNFIESNSIIQLGYGWLDVD